MTLPLKPPIEPQLARSKPELPVGDQWAYEPKYDGFRAIVFVDGDGVDDPVARRQAARALLPRALVPGRPLRDRRRDRDRRRRRRAGLRRAAAADPSGRVPRIAMLAEETPARFIAFDLLARDDESLLERPSPSAGPRSRRMDLEPIALTPLTARPRPRPSRGCTTARAWSPRTSARRTGPASARAWSRSSGCARSTPSSSATGPGKEPDTVGSLILGLYDDGGPTARRRALLGPAGGREARAGRQSSRRTRPASGATAIPAAGRTRRSSSGSSCGPSSSSRSPSTTPAAVASATARRSSAGARTRRRGSAASSR